MGDRKADELRDEMRRRIFLEAVPAFARLKGLEIGALCSPMFTKDQASVQYYDVAPKEELCESLSRYYPGRSFVDVDFVARDKPMAEVLGRHRFDYCIANHVVEHIPDFIGFFRAIHGHLNDGGKFFLAIPDRRLTFDYDRSETTAGHLIVDYEDGGKVDAAEHILDALIYHEELPAVYWSDVAPRRYDFPHHHHVFNYETFLEKIIKPLIRLRYFDFSVIACRQDPALYNEFVVVLEKDPVPDRIHVLGETVARQPRKGERPAGPRPPALCSSEEQMDLIARSGWFDRDWYVAAYPSVGASGMEPLEHYFFQGGFQGLMPSERFDSAFYLEDNPDVRQAGYNPLWHYLHNGRREGRRPLPGD